MILFDRIIPKPGSTHIIRFKNERGAIVDIPIDKYVANTISLHLQRISGTASSVERNNLDDIESSD